MRLAIALACVAGLAVAPGAPAAATGTAPAPGGGAPPAPVAPLRILSAAPPSGPTLRPGEQIPSRSGLAPVIEPASAAGATGSTGSVVTSLGAGAVQGATAPTPQGATARKPQGATARKPSPKQPKLIPGRYLVRVAPGASLDGRSAAVGQLGGRVKRILREPGLRLLVVEINDVSAPGLRSLSGVSDVWQDRVVELADTQSSPPWGLDRIDQPALPLNGTFTYDSNGAGVNAYIIDSGIAATHTDFGGRVLAGADFSGAGPATDDCNSHGTHVAGTVGGATYGVAKAVTLIPVRIFGCAGSTAWSTVVSAINWMIADHDPGEPAVANMSIGGGGYAPIDDAVQAAVADGITVVVAAGNNSADACGYSPARAPDAITVGAVASDDTRAYFSNYGSCVDVWAPGVGTVSADALNLPSGSSTKSGTSMATPHTAGGVARLLSANPDLTPADVAALVRGTAVSLPVGPLLQSPLYGSGAVPPAPTGLVATPQKSSARLAWDPAGRGIGGFRVTWPGGSADLPPSATSYVVEGLTNGVPATFGLAALNAFGWSPPTTATATPFDDGSPDPPTIRRVGSGDGWLALEVVLPPTPSGGAVTSITASATPTAGGTPVTASTAVTPGAARVTLRVTGLANQASYVVRAAAVNAVASSFSSQPRTAAPGASVAVGQFSTSVSTSAGNLMVPADVTHAVSIDEVHGIVWSGAGQTVVAMDTTDHLTTTGTIPDDPARWIVTDTTYGRTLAVPFYWGTSVKDLSLADNAIVATGVATIPSGTWAIAYDQSRHELITAGSSVTRLGVAASGALTTLPVPNLGLGSATVTSAAVYGSKVVLTSFTGGWLKVWDRDTGSVVTLSGLSYPGGLAVTSGGVLVGAGRGSVITRVGWDGVVRGSVDLRLPRLDGEPLYNYSFVFPSITLFDDTRALVSMSGGIASIRTDTLEILGLGEGFCCTAGGLAPTAVGRGTDGLYVASYWLTDVAPDLTTSQMSFAQGDYSNAAVGYTGGSDVAAVAVSYQNSRGLRLHHPPSAAGGVSVDAKSGAARISWTEPTWWGNGASAAQRGGTHERPFTYSVILQPGGITVPWRGGPLEVTVDGLDPGQHYTATVRVISPAGRSDAPAVPFTPAAAPGVPSPPTGVTAEPVRDGCVRVSWTPSAGATGGYSVTAIGLATAVSAPANATSAELCGLHPSPSQLPLVRARVSAIGSSGTSLPSVPSAPVQATLAPLIDGYTVDTAVDPASGATVALTMTNTALSTQARRSLFSVVDGRGVRTIPIPPRTNAILGFDPSDGVVYLGRCSVIPALLRVSLRTLEVSQVPLPEGGPWDLCDSMYDQQRRAVWLSPTTASADNPFRVEGGYVQAMSVDGARPIVARTPLNCAKPEWAGSYIGLAGSPRFLIDNGRVYVKCISRQGSGGYPMQLFRVTDAVTGAVVGESSTWLDIAGTTDAGEAILVDDTAVRIVGATTRTIPFPQPLAWASYTLGMPYGDNTNRFAKATKRVGSKVLAQSYQSKAYTVDVDTGSVGTTYAPFWPWFTADQATTLVAYSYSDVYVSDGTTTTRNPMEFPEGGWEGVAYVGQRITGLIQFDLPNPLATVGPGDLGVFGNVRAADNAGTATDESMMTAFWHLTPPATPASLSVTSSTVTWAAASTKGALAGPGRFEQPIVTDSYEVRDGSDQVRCTGAATTCTSSGAFSGGASVYGLLTTAVGSAFGRSSPATTRGTFLALSVSRAGSGSGSVTADSGGLSCGSACTASYLFGTSVTLTATAADGSAFTGWSGDCTGTSPTCTLALSSARRATATFAPVQVLSVARTGDGSGTVTADSGGLSCGTACTVPYLSGTSVTLTAAAADGSAFTGWSGACTGTTPTCTVTMTAARSVTATFAARYALTVARSGAGAGTVTADSGGLSCGSACTATYLSGTQVTLTATAAGGSAFTGWTGACTGTSATCTVTMSQARSTTATFTPVYALSVSRSGTGSGAVTADSGGLTCGSACSATYLSGTTVTLTAAAAAGSVLTGWSGACTGTSTTCAVTMTAARSATATFAPALTLTVTRAGTGSGRVTSSTGGIDCGTACTAPIASGSQVTLTATAAAGSRFTGWSGACSGTSTCTLTMSQARTATATFAPLYTLTVARTGTKQGSVSSSPTGVSCGTTCSASYVSGTSVTLTASTPSGGKFLGWSGACTGTTTKCTVTMSQARSVTAAWS